MSDRASVSVRVWPTLDDVRDVLARCLTDLGGMGRFVRPGQMVVVKPNNTADGPETSGGTTHVCLAEAVVEQVLACRPARVVVAEGTGAFGVAHETAFPTGGWREMARRVGVELLNLDAGPHDRLSLQGSRFPDALPFSRLVRECDVFISLPCLKTHITADYTVALKNSFCLTPQAQRTEIHRLAMIEQSLVDLNRVRKPDLIIVDGYDGAEGIAGGTDFERPAGARLMLAGDDSVAVDVISRDIMGIFQRTRYLDWAIEDGVGVGDRSRIDLLGDPISATRHRFMLPAEELTLLMPGLTLVDLDACSGCRVPALAAAARFRYPTLRRPVRIVYGRQSSAWPASDDATIVVGDCAQGRSVGDRGIPGCPPVTADIIAALDDLSCFCRDCAPLALALVEDMGRDALHMVRLSAAGSEVFQGQDVDRERWHVEVSIGDCMRRYVRILRERARSFGMDPQLDVIWVRRCPPQVNDMRSAICGAIERATSVSRLGSAVDHVAPAE